MRAAVNQTKDGLSVNVRGLTKQFGTVVLQEVNINGKLRGVVVETDDKVIKPRAEVRQWSKLRYVCSLGKYVDTTTREPVTQAKAAYLVGKDIYYLPVEGSNSK